MKTVRAFTLVEVMIVVTILAIIAALAAPTLGPLKHAIEVDGVSEQVAGFLGRARMEALAQRRCVRVTISAAQPPAVLVMELLNAFDCDDTPDDAPRADGATTIDPTNLWLEIDRLTLNRENIRVAFHPAPPETAGGAAPGSSVDELRFRSTGRLWALPASPLASGDGVVRVSHLRLPAAQSFKEVLVQRHGRICTHQRGVDLAGGPTWSCP